MSKLGILFCLTAVSVLAQDYKAAAAGGPPDQLAPGIREALQSRGVKIVDPDGFLFCELWLRSVPLSDSLSMEDAIQNGAVPQGALAGVIRFASPGADRRGQGFGPGLYTLRHSQGDSVLMIKATEDGDLSPPDFDQLLASSRNVSRTATPAALRFSKGSSDRSPRLEMTRDGEWIVHTRLGDTPVALLIVGVAKR